MPNFVVATLIVLLFGLYFPEIAIFDYVPFAKDPLGNLGSMVLPGISLALTVSVTISENTRAAVLEVSSQDYVMVAKAKGLRPRSILGNYLVRNALTPVITVTGLQLAALLGGSILIETIFTIPGMGQYPVQFDHHARLPGHPGHRAGGRSHRAADQRGRGHRLCPGRCAGQL